MFHLPDCSCTFSFSADPPQHLLDSSAIGITRSYQSLVEDEDSTCSSAENSIRLEVEETGSTPTNAASETKLTVLTAATSMPSESLDTSISTFRRADSDKSEHSTGLLQDCVATTASTCNDQDGTTPSPPINNNKEVEDASDDGEAVDIVEHVATPMMTRLLRSSSIVSSEFPTCPICLDPMTPIDHQHPLQCPTRHCHFNFCMCCIQALISSSKDDYELASDGNLHVKIYLNCPNCRADLSTSIRDVLLLRKVDMVLWLLDRQQKNLSDAQERTRQAMNELHVQQAIQQAREKEVIFWQTHHRNSMASLETIEDDDLNDDGEHKHDPDGNFLTLSRHSHRQSLHRYESSRRLRDGSFSYDEWGVEADLDNGVHSSFRGFSARLSKHDGKMCKDSSSKKHDNGDGTKPSSFRKPMDETLLQGLEKCMTHAEQLQIIHWMTAGEPDLLARAAELFWRIEDDARRGVMPADRQKVMNRRGSVFEIVEEARQIDCNTQQSSLRLNNNAIGSLARGMTPRQRQIQQQRAEQRRWEIALAERASLLERFPLPVRMPKAMVLELNQDPDARGFPLKFCDDNWDGTVLDAYTMLTITQSRSRPLATSSPSDLWNVTKKAQTSHPGVFHVLTQGLYKRHYGDVQLSRSGETPPRVLVASVQGAAGRQGVMKGDVVTHIDGVALTPEEQSAEALVALLRAKIQAKQGSVQLVLNAEASVAEALKRRAVVMEEHLNETNCS